MCLYYNPLRVSPESLRNLVRVKGRYCHGASETTAPTDGDGDGAGDGDGNDDESRRIIAKKAEGACLVCQNR